MASQDATADALAGRGSLRQAAGPAAIALAIFHVVSLASGKLEESGGLGWDGEGYARMATDALGAGTNNTMLRPLIPLLARIPYAFGLDILTSFHLLNYLYAFALYCGAALLLRLYGAPRPVVFAVVGSLALCVAPSKMFAFYPVQSDLGALALTTLAFYFVRADRRVLAGIGCVLAASSREFGVVAAIYGAHRAIRLKRPAAEIVATYLPAIATTVLIRLWVLSALAGDGRAPLSAANAFENLGYWTSPAFVAIFAYFATVLFGGISALLIVRPRWVWGRLREEPELGTFLFIVAGLTAVGSLDIWRYLVFTLPAALALVAQYFRGLEPHAARRAALAMVLLTLITQRPFQLMDTGLYFRDWFPLYWYYAGQLRELTGVWAARLASLLLLIAALALTSPSWHREPAEA